MESRYWIFGLLLFFVVALLAFKNYEVWTQPIELPNEGEAQKKSEKKTGVLPTVGIYKNPMPIQNSFTIAEKNIFSPERKEFPMQTANGKKPLVRPQVVLYGVTIAGDYQAASLVNPGRPLQKGEREPLTVKLGEKIGEYKLAKILSDRITLEIEGDSFEVLLYYPKIPKKRIEVKTESKPATASGTLPVPAGPSPGTTPSAETVKPAPPKETIAPTPSPTLPRRTFIPSRRMYYPPAGAPTQEPGGGN